MTITTISRRAHVVRSRRTPFQSAFASLALASFALACFACGSGSTDKADVDGGNSNLPGPDASAKATGDDGDSGGDGGSKAVAPADASSSLDASDDASPATDATPGTDASDASTLKPVLMGADATGNPAFSAATGLTAQVVRVYLPGGDSIPDSVAAAKLTQYYSAGESVVYSIKPDLSPDSEDTNKANLLALATSIASGGYASRTWIALHHEPYHELTGAQFQTLYGTYAPSVRAGGVRCGVIYQTYPLAHGEANYASDYTSGILADVDFIGIDVYPDGSTGGYSTGILDIIAPFTTYATDNGKPFQIDEIAVDSKTTGTQALQATWLAGLANLGSGAALVMYYEGSPGAFPNLVIENNPAAVTEWKALYQTLTTR